MGPGRILPAIGVCVLLVAAVAFVASPEAEAKGKQGAIYVQRHYNPDDLKAMGAAVGAEVYVYDTAGALISSGLGNGSWKPGTKIALDAGEYLVEVGNVRTPQHLRKVKVVAGQITEIKTGWVAVTTWPRKDQPVEGCAEWSARLRAYLVVDGQRHLVADNRTARSSERGRLQLPVGTYEIHFNGLAVPIEIKANKVHHMATGGTGPYTGENVRVSAEKSDDSKVPNVALCIGGSTHLLAGKWWLSQTEKIEDYPYEKRVWQEIEVPAIDEGSTRDLRTDSVGGRIFRGAGSEPKPLAAAEIASLDAYKKGVLKRSGSTGSKFKIDDDPF